MIERLGKVVRQQAYCDHDTAATLATTVDVHFFRVAFTEAAADREGFLTALRAALQHEQGYYVSLDAATFANGPSYITVGGWIGDQTLALLLFGLMQFHGVGDVITPARLGVTGDKADEMAGLGLVMCMLKADVLAAHARLETSGAPTKTEEP